MQIEQNNMLSPVHITSAANYIIFGIDDGINIFGKFTKQQPSSPVDCGILPLKVFCNFYCVFSFEFFGLCSTEIYRKRGRLATQVMRQCPPGV